VIAAGGGAPAYDVDHEVFAVLDRFKVDQNLVINMIGAWTVPGWVGDNLLCSWSDRPLAASRRGRHCGAAKRAEKVRVRALIILS
jgi:hypothetical protein